MSNKKKKEYIKKGASPLYKRPTVPIYIQRKDGIWQTYYTAKFGKKLFVYANIKKRGIKDPIKLRELAKKHKLKTIPLDVLFYKNTFRDLFRERSVKDQDVAKWLGSRFTSHLSAFAGITIPLRDILSKYQKHGEPPIIDVKDVYKSFKTVSKKVGDYYIMRETSELKNGDQIETTFQIDKKNGEFKIVTKYLNKKHLQPRVIEGKIELVKSKDGKNYAKRMKITNIKNYDVPELIGFLAVNHNKFDNIYIDKNSIDKLDDEMLLKLKQAGFVNSEHYNFSWLQDRTQEMKKLYKKLLELEGQVDDKDKGYVQTARNILEDLINNTHYSDIPHNIDTFFLLMNKEGILNFVYVKPLRELFAKYIRDDIKNHASKSYTLNFQNNTADTRIPISSGENTEKDKLIKSGLSRIIMHAYSVQYAWDNDTHFGYIKSSKL
jgi:hypothetical protein